MIKPFTELNGGLLKLRITNDSFAEIFTEKKAREIKSILNKLSEKEKCSLLRAESKTNISNSALSEKFFPERVSLFAFSCAFASCYINHKNSSLVECVDTICNFISEKYFDGQSVLSLFANNIYASFFDKHFDWKIYFSDGKKYFEDENIFLLHRLYEKHIAVSEKKKMGQHYTPDSIISFMINIIEYNGGSFFDPAAGCGGFVLEALLKAHEYKVFNSKIVGVEISPFAAMLFALSAVSLKAKSPCQSKTPFPIIHNDGLLYSDSGFAYAALNPPYIGEKGNRELFRQTIEKSPHLEKYYSAKMDYFYWFIITAFEKLNEGGKMAVLTPPYWYTAAGAKKLREYIERNGAVERIIFLEVGRVFRYTAGIHASITVISKLKKKVIKTQIVRVNIEKDAQNLEEMLKEAEIALKTGRNSLNICVKSAFVYGKEVGVWKIGMEEGEIEEALNKMGEGLKLSEIAYIRQGIVPNPQRITASHLREFSEEGYKKSQPIFVFREKEAVSFLKGLDDEEKKYFVRLYKNSAIDAFVIDKKPSCYLLYLDNKTPISKLPNIEKHISRFKPILEKRRECKTGSRKYFSLHWPREREMFERETIVCPYHCGSPAFALTSPPFFAAADIYYIETKEKSETKKLFLLGVLNSLPVRCWLYTRGRRKGKTIMLVSNAISSLPIPNCTTKDEEEVASIVKEIVKNKRHGKQTGVFENKLDKKVLSLYNLSHLYTLFQECVKNEEF